MFLGWMDLQLIFCKIIKQRLPAQGWVDHVSALLKCRLMWGGGDCGTLKGMYLV